jgi:hypothetical protein
MTEIATKSKPTFQLHDDDKWNAVADNEKAGFFEKVGTIDSKHNPSANTTEVHWRQLPFYRQVALVRLRDPNWDPEHLCIYYLTNKGELTRLDGTSPPIHMMNAEAPIKVTEENVLDYLRFFCFFVRGEEGPFLISETMETYGLPEGLDDTTKKAIEGVLRPASYEGKNPDGHFLCDAIVYYSNALFLSNFAIQPSGMIEMMEDDPLLTDLPVRVDKPVK